MGSDERIVAEFRANDGVVLGLPGGTVLLHVGGPPRRVVPVAAVLEGGAWLVAPVAGGAPDWAPVLRNSPDAAVETPAGSLDVHAIELEDEQSRRALDRFPGAAGPVFRLEPQG